MTEDTNIKNEDEGKANANGNPAVKVFSHSIIHFT